jgi:hypothetical protein
MSKSNAFETDLLELIFQGIAITGLAQNHASPVASLAVSLHTADPGEAGTQATNETTYGSYARVAIARTTGGWTVSGATVSPVANISFPTATSGTATLTHFGVGTNATAGQAGYLIYKGTISPNISVTSGVTPVLTSATTVSED